MTANGRDPLCGRALNRLSHECALAGKAELLGYVLPYLAAPEESAVPYDEISRRSQRPVPTLRSDVARLRRRYRAILREEVRGTVAQPTEVDEELRYLCRVLAVV
jgi:hypothetical protein